jgi:hypothetical protein
MLGRSRERHDPVMTRSFLFVSSFDPEAALRAALASPLEVELAVISRSDAACETAFTLDEAGLMRSADDLQRGLPLP